MVKADTGANGKVLPIWFLKQMYPGESDPCQILKQTSAKLAAANGTEIDNVGYIGILLQLDNSDWLMLDFINGFQGPPILSCDLSEKLG